MMVRNAEPVASRRMARLFEVARLLLSEEDTDRTAEVLFRRILEDTGAERGFVVVRDGRSYELKLHVRFDLAGVSVEERRFSRGLVRRVIETGELIHSVDVSGDPRFATQDSARGLRHSVLVVPLHHSRDVYGVIYLEAAASPAHFDEEVRAYASELGAMAGVFIRRALERENLRRRSHSLERELLRQHDFAGIVTQDDRMIRLLRTVAQVAASEATVLLCGETGTGKELFARALHVNSERRGRPFVTVDCAALPANVLESELFGHARGAFTGADRDRAGRIATAQRGTLFLDEIAELQIEAQAKLLRFLQFGELQRLGSDRSDKVDVRVVAATHQNLASLVKRGRFRQDLYFRLKVIELEIPPLRERRGDISLLLDYFLRQYRRAGDNPRFTLRAARALESHDYPGNVRELAHLVQRCCVLATGPELDLDLLPVELRDAAPADAGAFTRFTGVELQSVRARAVTAVERAFLEAVMARADGNISQAARDTGMTRSHLQKLLAKHRM
jgi:transcriptional regulator with GAF, ATPase, and Fis domain